MPCPQFLQLLQSIPRRNQKRKVGGQRLINAGGLRYRRQFTFSDSMHHVHALGLGLCLCQRGLVINSMDMQDGLYRPSRPSELNSGPEAMDRRYKIRVEAASREDRGLPTPLARGLGLPEARLCMCIVVWIVVLAYGYASE